MKRITVVLCVLIMAVSFGSCSGKDATKPVTYAVPDTTTVEPLSEPSPIVMFTAPEESTHASLQENLHTPNPIAVTDMESVGCTVEDNGYKIEVLSAERGKDYSGNNITVVNTGIQTATLQQPHFGKYQETAFLKAVFRFRMKA